MKNYTKQYTEEHYKGLFIKHVDVDPSGCHLWVGGKNNIGYGLFKHHAKMRTVHRLIMEWEGHDIIDKVVYHSCDNYNCVNPQHLHVGTNLEKAQVMTNKGRAGTAFTQSSYHSKCTYCNTIGNPALMARLHNERCKQKP